mmetsp:Transcript_33123/g.63586  ORF Transcript_33123/g.63586 Transcript_33123/m.63586 type:complete len:220 (-) Transcript_33123:1016-1675(-)
MLPVQQARPRPPLLRAPGGAAQEGDRRGRRGRGGCQPAVPRQVHPKARSLPKHCGSVDRQTAHRLPRGHGVPGGGVHKQDAGGRDVRAAGGEGAPALGRNRPAREVHGGRPDCRAPPPRRLAGGQLGGGGGARGPEVLGGAREQRAPEAGAADQGPAQELRRPAPGEAGQGAPVPRRGSQRRGARPRERDSQEGAHDAGQVNAAGARPNRSHPRTPPQD